MGLQSRRSSSGGDEESSSESDEEDDDEDDSEEAGMSQRREVANASPKLAATRPAAAGAGRRKPPIAAVQGKLSEKLRVNRLMLSETDPKLQEMLRQALEIAEAELTHMDPVNFPPKHPSGGCGQLCDRRTAVGSFARLLLWFGLPVVVGISSLLQLGTEGMRENLGPFDPSGVHQQNLNRLATMREEHVP